MRDALLTLSQSTLFLKQDKIDSLFQTVKMRKFWFKVGNDDPIINMYWLAFYACQGSSKATQTMLEFSNELKY